MNKERILISTIIPSYNRADTVGQTIESILAQKVDADMEIVIGDDCSTDNAREVLMAYKEKYPDIIRLFLREQNMGLGANWAQCVKDCRGEFICNCDNDDYWHNPNKLQLQLDYMHAHPGCNILITNHRTHNRSTGEIRECKADIDHTDIQQSMWGGGHFCNATIMYRADFMKAHLDLDEFIKRRLSLQDWPAWVILTAYTDIDVLPESTATFGIETISITRPDSLDRLEKRYERDRDVYQYLGELFPDKFALGDPHWEQYVNSRLMSKAFGLGDFDAARKYGKDNSMVGKYKRICSQHKWLFRMYRLAQKIKAKNKNGTGTKIKMLKEPYDCWQNKRYYEHNRPLDQETAKYLLITFKHVLEEHGIVMMPMFGTLLGAIREHGFIPKDDDVDVVIYAKDKDKVFALRPELEKYHIHLHCYVLPWIFTFEYKGMTIDVYPLYESVWPWTNHYYLLLEKYISRTFFDNAEDYELFGETFKVPANPENILAYLYGKTWRIPQSTKPKIESHLFFWRYAHRFVQRCMRYARRHLGV